MKHAFEERENALREGDLEKVKETTKTIKKWKQYERMQHVLEIIDKDLDVRETWAGIGELKTPYKPIPYAQKRKDGTKIRIGDRAEEAAFF